MRQERNLSRMASRVVSPLVLSTVISQLVLKRFRRTRSSMTTSGVVSRSGASVFESPREYPFTATRSTWTLGAPAASVRLPAAGVVPSAPDAFAIAGGLLAGRTPLSGPAGPLVVVVR